MRLPAGVAAAVEQRAGGILSISRVGGGCIAHASRVEAARGAFFLKWAPAPAGLTFEAEAIGLEALGGAPAPLVVPEVLSAVDAQDGQPGHLLMNWIEQGRPGPRFDEELGEGLAALHAATEPAGRYGFARDNFIGRLPQRNDWRDDWPAFFGQMRLEPQIRMARDAGHWRSAWNPLADRLLERLAALLPARPPAALCHGDLWSGNVMASAQGHPVLIDPAVYFGHGETDLAMMTLFGGFSRRAFEAYHAVHPRSSGHAEREAIYQLYHLLSHLNHFGSSYAGAVERVLRRFGSPG